MTTYSRSALGFIGLGVMGRNIASRLLDAGNELTVFDIDMDRINLLVERGAKAASSPAEVGSRSDIVFTSVPTGLDLASVLSGQDGLLVNASKAKKLTIVDFSTIGPTWAEKLADTAKSVDVPFLDAPVGGGWTEAREGNLVLLVGGMEDTLNELRPILTDISKAIFYFGGSGTGQAAKVALNLSQAVLMVGAAEAVRLLKGNGANLSVFLESLKSLDANPWFQRPLTYALGGDLPEGMRMTLMLKDVRLAIEVGEQIDVRFPAGEIVRNLLEDAENRGLGNEPLYALVKLYD